MDANKAKVLGDIGYKVLPTCRTCQYFKQGSDKRFGDCQAFTYQHGKHTGDARALSVHMSGSCDNYMLDDREKAMMHGFTEFLIVDSAEEAGD